MTYINTKIDEANKPLLLILAQLIRPNAVHPDGYVILSASNTSPTSVTQLTSASIVTPKSRSIASSAVYVHC